MYGERACCPSTRRLRKKVSALEANPPIIRNKDVHICKATWQRILFHLMLKKLSVSRQPANLLKSACDPDKRLEDSFERDGAFYSIKQM